MYMHAHEYEYVITEALSDSHLCVLEAGKIHHPTAQHV